MKIWKQFINESLNDDVNNIIEKINTYTKKIKINKPHILYNNGVETAISNSEITKFFTRYQRENFKKYIKSVPFPFEKLSEDNITRFNKLNDIAHIFENYSDTQLLIVKYKCLHLMDIILYDMYFDIKSRNYDIYEKVDEITIPDKNNIIECKKFGLWFSDKENPLNYIVFFSNSIPTVNIVRNYSF